MSYFRRLVSFSELDLFDLCERKYYFEKILLEPQKPSAILEVGQTYHRALASYWTSDLSTAALATSAVLAHTEKLKPFGVDLPGLTTELTENLRRIIDTVISPGQIRPVVLVEGPAVEKRFENHRIGFKGVTDILSQVTPIVDAKGHVTGNAPGRCVLDWKSLTSDRRRSQRDCDMSPQLALYAINSGVKAAGFVEIPRNLERDIRVRVVHYTEEDLQSWLIYLQAQRRTLIGRGKVKERYRMTARKNPLCSPLWCNHYGACYPYAESPDSSLTAPETVVFSYARQDRNSPHRSVPRRRGSPSSP